MSLLPPGATKVDLSNKGLGDDGAARLAEELLTNTSVTELNLQINDVGAAGSASLASALEKNATLQSLNLAFNGVGAAGAASLASALEKNATLQMLVLDETVQKFFRRTAIREGDRGLPRCFVLFAG